MQKAVDFFVLYIVFSKICKICLTLKPYMLVLTDAASSGCSYIWISYQLHDLSAECVPAGLCPTNIVEGKNVGNSSVQKILRL